MWTFFISILDEVPHNLCPNFTLNSNGPARQFHPEIMVDYLLLSVKNNGRVVYRSKEMVFKYATLSYVYLNSFNAEEYEHHENYERLAFYHNVWIVRYIEYLW